MFIISAGSSILAVDPGAAPVPLVALLDAVKVDGVSVVARREAIRLDLCAVFTGGEENFARGAVAL
jgi:hypothetical protein